MTERNRAKGGTRKRKKNNPNEKGRPAKRTKRQTSKVAIVNKSKKKKGKPKKRLPENQTNRPVGRPRNGYSWDYNAAKWVLDPDGKVKAKFEKEREAQIRPSKGRPPHYATWDGEKYVYPDGSLPAKGKYGRYVKPTRAQLKLKAGEEYPKPAKKPKQAEPKTKPSTKPKVVKAKKSKQVKPKTKPSSKPKVVKAKKPAKSKPKPAEPKKVVVKQLKVKVAPKKPKKKADRYPWLYKWRLMLTRRKTFDYEKAKKEFHELKKPPKFQDYTFLTPHSREPFKKISEIVSNMHEKDKERQAQFEAQMREMDAELKAIEREAREAKAPVIILNSPEKTIKREAPSSASKVQSNTEEQADPDSLSLELFPDNLNGLLLDDFEGEMSQENGDSSAQDAGFLILDDNNPSNCEDEKDESFGEVLSPEITQAAESSQSTDGTDMDSSNEVKENNSPILTISEPVSNDNSSLKREFNPMKMQEEIKPRKTTPTRRDSSKLTSFGELNYSASPVRFLNESPPPKKKLSLKLTPVNRKLPESKPCTPTSPKPVKSLISKTQKQDTAKRTPRRVKFTIPVNGPYGGGKYARLKKAREKPVRPLNFEELQERIRVGAEKRSRQTHVETGFMKNPNYRSPVNSGKQRPRKLPRHRQSPRRNITQKRAKRVMLSKNEKRNMLIDKLGSSAATDAEECKETPKYKSSGGRGASLVLGIQKQQNAPTL